MAHHNYLIGHNTSPDRNKTNPSRLTALTPQNQPERPLLRGNHVCIPDTYGIEATILAKFIIIEPVKRKGGKPQPANRVALRVGR